MENATKALIIAGAVLISILLISVGIMVFNSASDPINQSQNNSEAQAIQIFNNTFTEYLGENKSGSQVKNLVSAIIASNSKNEDHQVTINKNAANSYKISSISTKLRYKVEETINDDGYIEDITITKMSESK